MPRLSVHSPAYRVAYRSACQGLRVSHRVYGQPSTVTGIAFRHCPSRASQSGLYRLPYKRLDRFQPRAPMPRHPFRVSVTPSEEFRRASAGYRRLRSARKPK